MLPNHKKNRKQNEMLKWDTWDRALSAGLALRLGLTQQDRAFKTEKKSEQDEGLEQSEDGRTSKYGHNGWLAQQ